MSDHSEWFDQIAELLSRESESKEMTVNSIMQYYNKFEWV
jgi:hypothetical protein